LKSADGLRLYFSMVKVKSKVVTSVRFLCGQLQKKLIILCDEVV